MIRYSLLCEHDHEFESWFDSSAAYDKLQKSRLVECPHCGSFKTRKALMTPQIGAIRSGKRDEEEKVEKSLSQISDPTMQNLQKKTAELQKTMVEFARQIREQVHKNAENVGANFAREARKIHYEECEPRDIYGKATAREVQELQEEGVEFTPLPELPEDKN